MARLKSIRYTLWRRHLHPASGWSRVVLGFALPFALWHHAWAWLGVLAVGIATNPFWFPPPKKLDNFMSRAVLGERVWIETAGFGAKAGLYAAGAVLFAALAWTLWTRRLAPGAGLFAAIVAFKAWFLVRVSHLPRRAPDATEQVLGQLLADAGAS